MNNSPPQQQDETSNDDEEEQLCSGITSSNKQTQVTIITSSGSNTQSSSSINTTTTTTIHHQQRQKSCSNSSLPGASSGNSTCGSQRNSGAIELSDDEEWNSLVERAVLERTKSDRSQRSGGDEDRRRRTIIVEKKNGTYGFTLQSYGIHYKREQEIEMVTYVDYVEYDGPAFKAGMREGDVILSINGQEMDRADHKTLVNFIKNCDSRMRMVVSFEDCVRKVELHMRYIELQRALQTRLNELERLCERERSILVGRWKTHSLPARKRTPSSQPDAAIDPSSATTLNSAAAQSSCCRPASSTEHLLLYNVYADGRSFLIPRNAACLVAIGPPTRSRSDHHHFLSNVSVESISAASNSSSRHSYHQANGLSNSSNTPSKSKDRSSSHSGGKSSSQHGQQSSQHQLQQQSQQQQPQQSKSENQNLHPSTRNLCVACISSAGRRSRHSKGEQSQGDGASLDAYDLASPCCDPNCVPSRRRRDKQRRSRHEHGSQTHQHQHHHLQQQQQQQQQQAQQQATQTTQQREQRDAQQQTNCSRASVGHSLHSLASCSEMSNNNTGSVVSCSTSLSTDTLYWDPSVQHRPPTCMQYAKPKSWDNLTTKAFGGYGFGYGYLDTTSKSSTHSAERPSKSGSTSSSHHGRTKTPSATTATTAGGSCSSSRRTSSSQVYSSTSSTNNRHFQPTKSTESLLIGQPYPSELDATLSCDCLDGPSPRFIAVQLEKHKRQHHQVDSSYNTTRSESHASGGHQSSSRHRRSSHSDAKQRSSINNSELTRL